MSRRTWKAAMGVVGTVMAGVVAVSDLLNAEGLIRSTWRTYFPAFPREIVLKPVEIRSLGSYICATKEGKSLKVEGLNARLLDNDCQKKMDGVARQFNSNYPKNKFESATYTIIVNGLSTDIKTLALVAGSKRSELRAVLPEQALAHCNSVGSKDKSLVHNEKLTLIEAQLEHGGRSVSHVVNHEKGSEQKGLQDEACEGVFSYPY